MFGFWLNRDDNAVKVSRTGGSVLEWFHGKNSILGPQADILVGARIRTRGVSHWCWPFYGNPPDPAGEEEWHGSLRKATMKVTEEERQKLSLVTVGEDGKPVEGGPKITVLMNQHGFKSILSMTNMENRPIPILPAFHPYFRVPRSGLSVEIGGKIVAESWCFKPGEALIFDNESTVVRVHGGQTTIMGNHWHTVIWSDRPDLYMCVEQIFGSLDTYGLPTGRWMRSGQKEEFGVEFQFTPNN